MYKTRQVSTALQLIPFIAIHIHPNVIAYGQSTLHCSHCLYRRHTTSLPNPAATSTKLSSAHTNVTMKTQRQNSKVSNRTSSSFNNVILINIGLPSRSASSYTTWTKALMIKVCTFNDLPCGNSTPLSSIVNAANLFTGVSAHIEWTIHAPAS